MQFSIFLTLTFIGADARYMDFATQHHIFHKRNLAILFFSFGNLLYDLQGSEIITVLQCDSVLFYKKIVVVRFMVA